MIYIHLSDKEEYPDWLSTHFDRVSTDFSTLFSLFSFQVPLHKQIKANINGLHKKLLQ